MAENRLRRQEPQPRLHSGQQAFAVRVAFDGLCEDTPLGLCHPGDGRRLREHGQHGFDRLAASDAEPTPLALNESAHA